LAISLSLAKPGNTILVPGERRDQDGDDNRETLHSLLLSHGNVRTNAGVRGFQGAAANPKTRRA
jgi:hypothetical protein